MDAETFISMNRATLANVPYELKFADTVLRGLDGLLDFANVRHQHELRTEAGQLRIVDFTISEGDRVRIATRLTD